MVMVLVFFAVSILSSTAGSICGIGGGVIIKPVLDALGVMSVSSISFLSGCTVLAMSVVSVYKNLRSGTARMDLKIATSLAIGAAAGGVAGKAMFQSLKEAVGDENLVGMTQALVLIAITLATLFYTIYKEKIHTRKCDQIWLCVLIGLLLGIMSSFLGIGGGPINLMVLGYFFSMSTKEAALSSLYIILFSLLAGLLKGLPWPHPALACALTGFLETTNGISLTAASNLPARLSFALILGTAAFGGLSGLAQTQSMIDGSGLSLGRYLKAKLLTALAAASCALALEPFLS